MDPTRSTARAYYSQLLHYLGREEEAAAEIERAVREDPFDARVRTLQAMDLNFVHRYDDAEAVLQDVLSRSPGYGLALTTLRTTYHLMGRRDEALEMWRESNARDPEALAALEEGYAAGGYQEALRRFAQMLEARSDTAYVTPWQIGTAYTRAGEGELALDYLERAFEERDQNIPYMSVDPIFDYLRDEPRFQAMMERLGIAEDVAEFTKGEVILGPGTLYKCLRGLADAGSISRVHDHMDDPEGASHRKHYRITASGTAELKRMLVGLNRAMAVGKARVGVPQGAQS